MAARMAAKQLEFHMIKVWNAYNVEYLGDDMVLVLVGHWTLVLVVCIGT